MSDSETTLLMDGDVLAFVAASAAQKIEEDDFGYLRPFANVAEGEAILENSILKLADSLSATHVRVVLSDPESNWRHEIMPSYKGNRNAFDTGMRPLLLGRLKEHLRLVYGAVHWAGLEADDVLGILATEPQEYPGRRIVVGRDKDFKSIPGLHHQMGSDVGHIEEISEWEADRFHLMQSLSGDRVDGYPGCPGLGLERAARIIDDPRPLSPKKGIITRGPRKGQETVKWVRGEVTRDHWAVIVSHYVSEGLTEADALLTARVARILRHEDYDRKNDRLILWTPERLNKWRT